MLDHAGNALRHGHPAAPRLWSLEGRAARQKAEAAQREREARATLPPLPEEIAGQLVPLGDRVLDIDHLRSMPLRRALALCETEADVRLLGRLRGYKAGWAWHVIRERREAAA